MTDYRHRFWPAPDEDDFYGPGLCLGLVVGVVIGAIGGLIVGVLLMATWYADQVSRILAWCVAL